MAKFKERIWARELRYKGESVGRIAKIVGAGKSTVSLWCSDIYLSELQKENLDQRNKDTRNKGRLIANENRKRERLDRVSFYKSVGMAKINELSRRELFLVGAALYWAEGGKNQRRVVFINSDPKMIVLWVSWITKCLQVSTERLTCRVEINEIHEKRLRLVENYWSNITNIPRSQFIKASLKHSKTSKVYKNYHNYFGSLQITVKKGTNLNYEILGYIDGLAGVAREN